MLGEIRGEVRFKEPLGFHTSLRIGGTADIFVVPQDVEDIRLALSFAEREQLPVEVLGGGVHLLAQVLQRRGHLVVALLGDRLELQVETPIGRQCVVVLGYAPVGIGERGRGRRPPGGADPARDHGADRRPARPARRDRDRARRARAGVPDGPGRGGRGERGPSHPRRR